MSDEKQQHPGQASVESPPHAESAPQTEKPEPQPQEQQTVKSENQQTESETQSQDQPSADDTAVANEQDLKDLTTGQPTAEADEPDLDPIAVLEAELAALKDKFLRQTADMENLRRRTEREKQEMAKYAITNFARDIITLDDNLSRTLGAVPESAIEQDPALKALVEGVEMTSRELTNVLERYNITRIDPKGDIFDPNCHQAMFEMPNPEVPSGTILEVVAPGFMIENRVLRPAMVGVAKGGDKPKKATADANQDTPENQPNDKNVDNTV